MSRLIIEAERAGNGWFVSCAGRRQDGKSLALALQRIVADLGRDSALIGFQWECPEAAMTGTIQPASRRAGRGRGPELPLSGGRMRR